MDPYLEQSGIWNQIHTDLIVYIRRHLTSLLRPRYVVAIEQRTFAETSDQSVSIADRMCWLYCHPAQHRSPRRWLL